MTKQCRICGGIFEPILNGHTRQFCFNCVPLDLSDSDRTIYKRRSLKKQLVLLKGGKCLKCEESRIHVLEFHHLDPSKKDNTIAFFIKESRIEECFKEVEKCVILCSNCHKDFHYLQTTIEKYLNIDKLPVFKKSNVNRSYNYVDHRCIICNEKVKKENTKCKNCSDLERRKVKERPSGEQLIKEIQETSFVQVGKFYGVSDNAVRKWLKQYGLPCDIKSIKEFNIPA